VVDEGLVLVPALAVRTMPRSMLRLKLCLPSVWSWDSWASYGRPVVSSVSGSRSRASYRTYERGFLYENDLYGNSRLSARANGLHYNTGSFVEQYGSVLKGLVRRALPTPNAPELAAA